MTTRSMARWADLGGEGAVADIGRSVVPAPSEEAVRKALAYAHEADLDDVSITAPEGRNAAIDALTRGYLDTYRVHGRRAVAWYG